MRYSTLFLYLLILPFIFEATTAQIPTTGLVAHWPFSGNANDASGNGHHGTATTFPQLTFDRFRRRNSAYLFNGTSDRIRIPHHSDLNPTSSFSISLWFLTCNSPETDATILDKEETERDRNGYAVWVHGGGADNLRLGTTGHRSTIGTSFSVTTGGWTHAVCMFKSDSAYIYINDSLVVRGARFSSTHTGNDNDLYIGWAARIPFNSYFPGKIDDIRLYNRLLTRQEISALYHENGWPSINGQPFSIDVDSLGSSTICAGDTALATLAGNASYYRVAPTDGVIDLRPGTIRLAPEVSTTYIFRAILYTGDPPCRDSLVKFDTLHVTVKDAPTMSPNPLYECRGTSTLLGTQTTGGTPPYTWQWSPQTGLDDPSRENPTLSIDSSRRYSVLITDAKGCSTIVDFPVTVLEAPEVEIVAYLDGDTLRGDTLRYCRTDDGLPLTAEARSSDDSLSYLWIEAEGLSRTDTSTVLAQSQRTAVYIVEVRDRAGICPGYDTVVVLPQESPAITAGSDTRLCPGNSHELGASTNDPTLLYTWTPDPSLDDPSLPQPTATPTTTTIYYVTATDTVTGCSTTDSVTVTIEDIQLRIVESSLDFEPLDGCQSTANGSITVRNDGTDPATLLTGQSRDNLVVLIGGQRSIPAGEETTVEFRFSPSTAGTYSGDIVLHFGPCGDSLVLPYTGERATSNVSATPGAHDFGRAADCETEPQQVEVVVANSGTEDATIAAPSLTAPYTVVSPTLPTTLPQGETLTITIAYAPTGVGDFARTMYIPFQTGTCSDSIPVELSGEVWEPMLTTNDAPLNFGLLDGCTTEEEGVIEIQNPGEEPLDIEVVLPTGVTLLGSPADVPAGRSRTLQLRYAPAGTGTLNGDALVIYGPCRDTLRVPMTGEKRGVSFAIADTLDFGEICLGGGAALPLGVLLDSEGTGNGAVVEAVFTGGGFVMDEMDRMDIMDGDGAELEDGVERALTVLFEPTVEGQVTGMLRLRLEPCGVERTVVLRGSATSVQLSSAGLDFGTVPSGTTPTGTLAYTNTGTSTLRIEQLDESALGGTPFTVLSTTPPLPVDLAAGETLEISVEYTATAGVSTGSLGAVITGACDTTVLAMIRGTGESTGFVRLKLPQLAGEPGEELLLRIEVLEASGLPNDGVDFRAEISVEPSILAVADATPWRIANDGARIIEVNGTIRPDDPVAASIPVTALLGRVESSPLEVVTLELSDPGQQISLESEDGSLEILGLCREEGVRLFDPSGKIAIKSIAPSPTQDRMTITYSLSETGEHRMILIDAGGREVMEIFSGMFLPGTFELVRDVRGLPSGAYRLVLETPTMRVSEGVVIGR